MRHYIQISARHKLLVINRAYLAHGGSQDAEARAHEACVHNAKAILEELDRGQQQGDAPMQSLWTIPYHSVAAAVVLALDMIKIGSSGTTSSELLSDRKVEIHRATQALQRLAPTSRIARRGLQVRSSFFVLFVILTLTGTLGLGRGDRRSISRVASRKQRLYGKCGHQHETVSFLPRRERDWLTSAQSLK